MPRLNGADLDESDEVAFCPSMARARPRPASRSAWQCDEPRRLDRGITAGGPRSCGVGDSTGGGQPLEGWGCPPAPGGGATGAGCVDPGQHMTMRSEPEMCGRPRCGPAASPVPFKRQGAGPVPTPLTAATTISVRSGKTVVCPRFPPVSPPRSPPCSPFPRFPPPVPPPVSSRIALPGDSL